MSELSDLEKEYNIKHIFTFAGVVAVAIASSYIIRGYLDILRIQALKRDLNYKQNPMNDE